MHVYLINVLMILFWDMLIAPGKNETRKRCYSAIVGIQWGLLAGLRADSVGRDTATYHAGYDGLNAYSLQDLFDNLVSYISGGAHTYNDPGFWLFAKLFQSMGLDYRAFSLMTSLFVALCLAFYIHRNSTNLLMSWILYSCVFYSFLSFGAARQALAISLAGFLGFEAIKSKRYLAFSLLLVLAACMHRSALVCLFFLTVNRIKVGRTFYAFSIGLWLVLFFFSDPIVNRMLPFFGYELYLKTYVGQRTWLYLAGLSAIWAVAAITREKRAELDARYDNMLLLLTIGLMFSAFALHNSNAFRVSYYFIFSTVALVPMIVERYKPRSKTLAILVFTAVCMVFFMATAGPTTGTPANPTGSYIWFWMA